VLDRSEVYVSAGSSGTGKGPKTGARAGEHQAETAVHSRGRGTWLHGKAEPGNRCSGLDHSRGESFGTAWWQAGSLRGRRPHCRCCSRLSWHCFRFASRTDV